MHNDWRLTNQMNYLYRVPLKREQFKQTERNDYEHCECCWAKFSETEDCLKSGYCTMDRYRWICDECFRDFQKQFEWELTNSAVDG